MAAPARKPLNEMSVAELNVELEWWLEAKKAADVLDIKAHPEIRAGTNPTDFKRAMINVFRQEADGHIQVVGLRDVSSFDQLHGMLLATPAPAA